MKKGIIIAITLCLIMVIGGYNIFFSSEDEVKTAITYFKAKKMIREEGYYIIYQKKAFFEESGDLYYFDGNNRGPVILIGRNPYNMHGHNGNAAIFCGNANNKFLVRGKKEEKFNDILKETVLYVEDWEIIAPIKRAYAEEYTHRNFYPINCIDGYDVEKGDYIPDTVGNQTLYSWEADYYLKNGVDYYLISPQRKNGILYWYLCCGEISDKIEILTQKVELKGDFVNMEKCADIFNQGKEEERYHNFILVKGKKEDNIIQVEKWLPVGEIYRIEDENKEWHSTYFFDERDY